VFDDFLQNKIERARPNSRVKESAANMGVTELEREALEILTPVLAQATEKMIVLSSLIVRKLLGEMMSSHEASARVSAPTTTAVEAYVNCITIALDYTQIEDLGVGWGQEKTQEVSKNEFIAKLARSLREDIRRVSGLRPASY
jgi:hypothetical protein